MTIRIHLARVQKRRRCMIIVTGENGQKMKRLHRRATSICAKHCIFNENCSVRLLAEQTVKAASQLPAHKDLWLPYCNLTWLKYLLHLFHIYSWERAHTKLKR